MLLFACSSIKIIQITLDISPNFSILLALFLQSMRLLHGESLLPVICQYHFFLLHCFSFFFWNKRITYKIKQINQKDLLKVQRKIQNIFILIEE